MKRRSRIARDDSSSVLAKAVGLVVVGLLVAGGVVLATWDIKPPTRSVEKVIPNDRF
ncbi:hypothetical protein [Roseospira visakhapatnamensis]|uniref:Uncharacterized protein n=1 Tax=Roseospira visakhapatnamensis TaxID=390880 RepID=A0A7W6W8C5_9PROT|nr:hypothetical protein [Roseospira visakhapatnamensis]MBB4264663.1 hypothetical protein [Roseospira visakhapatnamensis]